MAIIVYKCNVCNREVEKLQNKKGLEVIQRCIITNGCRGKLFQTEVKQDHVRGELPKTVRGLEDWAQRRALYQHNQTIKKPVWKVIHNMEIIPFVSAWVSRPSETDPDFLVEVNPDNIITISKNEIHLTFSQPESGIAHMIATDTAKQQTVETATEESVSQLTQITANGEISVAVPVKLPNESPNQIGLQLTFINEDGEVTVHNFISIDSQASIVNSPWYDYDRIVIKGKVYSVRSFNLIEDPVSGGIIDSVANRLITSGTTFTFTGIDPAGGTSYRTIKLNEVYILLANSPYATYDKIRGQLIDVSSNTDQFVYASGEASVLTSEIRSVYPLIISV